MICIKADIPEELNEIDDELKAIYHSKDTVCFFILKTRELRNKFVEETKGMNKSEREKVYEVYNSCLLYTSPSPRDRQKSRMPSSA